MELFKQEITPEVANQWFSEDYERKGTPVIEITTTQLWGKKPVTGVHVGIVYLEHDVMDNITYTMKNFCLNIPCVRIPLSQAMPVSRKTFKPALKEALVNWTHTSSISLEHPYRKTVEAYIASL